MGWLQPVMARSCVDETAGRQKGGCSNAGTRSLHSKAFTGEQPCDRRNALITAG